MPSNINHEGRFVTMANTPRLAGIWKEQIIQKFGNVAMCTSKVSSRFPSIVDFSNCRDYLRDVVSNSDVPIESRDWCANSEMTLKIVCFG